jgi:deoxyadenosine/deoxycytidine kinase
MTNITRIEICGGIASGKTTFASLFKKNHLIPVYEDFKKSPFWEAFYCNPGKYIFETEISFALLHYHQIKLSIESKPTNLICDFSFFLDLAYAKMGLTDSKLNTFETVYTEIKKELGRPNLLIHLECDAQTELDRIQKRARQEESLIDYDFLENLNQAVENEVKRVQEEIPVLVIDSAQRDFAHDEKVQQEMISLISQNISSQV